MVQWEVVFLSLLRLLELLNCEGWRRELDMLWMVVREIGESSWTSTDQHKLGEDCLATGLPGNTADMRCRLVWRPLARSFVSDYCFHSPNVIFP